MADLISNAEPKRIGIKCVLQILLEYGAMLDDTYLHFNRCLERKRLLALGKCEIWNANSLGNCQNICLWLLTLYTYNMAFGISKYKKFKFKKTELMLYLATYYVPFFFIPLRVRQTESILNIALQMPQLAFRTPRFEIVAQKVFDKMSGNLFCNRIEFYFD